MNGLTKTIVALLPAIGAHIVAFLVRGSQSGVEVWLGLAVGLLVVGGILTATFLVGAMFRNKPGQNKILAVFLFIVIVLGYLATFFFTGCLLAFAV